MAVDYALILGIDHYRDGSLSTLAGAINDATDFEKWVVDPNGGGVAKENRVLLTSEEGLTKLILSQIEDEFEVLFNKAKRDRTNTRRFYFFFSGHGFGIDLDSASLAMTNWTRTLANRGISSRKFHKKIQESGVFKETFFFLDCCRSSKVNIEGQTPGLWIPGIHSEASTVKSLTAFATRFSDVAIEAEFEGRRNGYFTKALLEALTGQAVEPDGRITRSSLEGFLNLRTKELSQRRDWFQDVVIDNKKFLPDDTLLELQNTNRITDTGEEMTVKVIIHFTDEMTGKYELIDKDALVVDTWENGDKEWEVSLRPGLGMLKNVASSETKAFRVESKSEQHVKFE